MTTEVFAARCEQFTALVRERPLWLIFDGQLTHVSIEVTEKAMEEDVTILKLPLHVTDKLQPLDVACFGPLKRAWGKNPEYLDNPMGTQGTNEESSLCQSTV